MIHQGAATIGDLAFLRAKAATDFSAS